jgi:two-component system, OmpR family, sensor histidine kinase KdpD
MGSPRPKDDCRPDPDELLKLAEAEEPQSRAGQLKIFLGYYSGVGKSFRMLDEGRRRHDRGEDVVIGALQPKLTPEIQPLLAGIEQILELEVDGARVMDIEAIKKRHPEVCLVDGLAYDNPPASKNAYRWQDVNDLLESGISVITSINLVYIEEQSARVERITGKHVTQTVPQKFILRADEIVVVDAPPGLLSESAPFENKLSELREMALVLAADVVDRQLKAQSNWGAQERVLVCVTPRANAAPMIASGLRNTQRFHGELFAISVTQPETTPEDQAALDRNLALARQAGAKVELLDGGDPAAAILGFARDHGITQIFVGHSKRTGMLGRFGRGPIDRLIDEADDIDVRVFPN